MVRSINNKCTCGSRKKYKNCCGRKKPRTYSFSLNPSILNTHDGIALEKSTGRILGIKNNEIVPLPGECTVNIHYKRESGKPKHLQNFTFNSKDIQLEPNLVLTKYKHYFFIDTNKKIIDDDEVFLASVVHAYINFSNKNEYLFNYSLLTYLEYHNIKGKFENFSWCELIKAIHSSNDYKDEIAIIVDSDFDQLVNYNNRSQPIYADFYLPDNFTLIYATAEKNTKNDSLLNRMMFECDKSATRMLNQERTLDPSGLKYHKNMPYTAFRQWID